MSKLVLLLPGGTTRDIALRRERTAIGRRADNDICLPNLAVSGEHAVIVTILTDSFLEDLGSTNGTLVNGKPVAKHFLRDRDQIEIGRHKLIYCADDDAVIEAEAGTGAARPARTTGDAIEYVKTPSPAGQDESRGDPAMATPVQAPVPPPPLTASVRVLTGLSAGAAVPLIKEETTIGRPGVQVAAIVKSGNAFLIRRIEGGEAPIVNGKAIIGEATELAHGDQIDIVGTRLEFALPEQPQPEIAHPAEDAGIAQGR
jgi:predicted component of type VI protein secretion system